MLHRRKQKRIDHCQSVTREVPDSRSSPPVSDSTSASNSASTAGESCANAARNADTASKLTPSPGGIATRQASAADH